SGAGVVHIVKNYTGDVLNFETAAEMAEAEGVQVRTVLVNDEALRSCATAMRDVEGKRVVTIEGLAPDGRLHPIQEAFVKHLGFQCGYCTPGMILGAYALLHKNPRPTHAQILAHMDDHLCRCGSHVRIVQAVETAAVAMKGGAR
ncbi:MAG: 2Fe-2S iron-sulfur cluster-binding protein, partial [Acidobacteria bacterium]|nr:2Fe-2S iron-sulfur cluster-binding protein [Acidobacteriota bacterium]